MTFREKLKLEHPDEVSDNWTGGCCGCPKTYGYELYTEALCAKEKVNSCESVCRACWDRTIPGTEEPVEEPKLSLNALIERAGTKKDISLTIFISGDHTHISVYPCPDPSEKKGNSVAEAYKLLVGSGYKTIDMERAIDYLGEALVGEK